MYGVLLLSFPLMFVLFGPLMAIAAAVTPWKGFRTSSVRHRKRRYTTLHLSIYDRVGHLTPRRAARFHRSFLTTLQLAIRKNSGPVYFTSHLMRPAHMKSLKTLMASMEDTHRWRCIAVTLTPVVRNGIRLQILVQEWRWITVPETGVLVLIRPRRKVR